MPLRSELTIADADADGSTPGKLVPGMEIDYDASFSCDGEWVVLTSAHRAQNASRCTSARVRMTMRPIRFALKYAPMTSTRPARSTTARLRKPVPREGQA